MNPTLLALVGPLTAALLGLLAFLFKRGLVARLDEIAVDVKEVKKDVSDHATRIAKAEVRIEDLNRRMDKSEDRHNVA